jgi:integrase
MGKTRRLVLSAEAVEVLKEQREKYGAGLLFRTRVGNPCGVC